MPRCQSGGALRSIRTIGHAGVLLGCIACGDAAIALRALLVAVFLVLTAPVATHALAAHQQDQAARTESTGGRRRAAVRQEAPASAEAKTSPEVAPK